MAEMEGINLKITGDSSQAVKAAQEAKKAINDIKGQEVEVTPKVDYLGRLHKANGQFMSMGEKLAENFNSAFMKKFAVFSVEIDKIGKQFEGTFGSIFKTITASATAVTGLIGKVLKDSLSIGGGFEAQMTSAKVISGATAEEFEKLTAKAREMGATLPITAAQAAQAMTIMAQRGTNVTDILTSVERDRHS